MRLCCECKETIKLNATKCFHCSSVQGWRRLLRAPLIFFGFALTIVSIWAADPIKQILDPKTANIRPSIISGDYRQIKIMLTNLGTRSATVISLEISARTKQGHIGTWYLITDLDGKLLEPKKSFIVTASNGEKIPSFVERFRSNSLKKLYNYPDNCILLVNYLEVNGQETSASYPFMCDPVEIGATHESSIDR